MRKRRANGVNFMRETRVVETCASTTDRLGVATRERGEQTRRGSRIANTYLADADYRCATGDHTDALPPDAYR